MNRLLDLVAAMVGVVFTSPLMVLLAGLVKLDSPGPVLFRQARVGRHGRVFEIYKFRTMRTQQVGPSVTSQGDPRITRAGDWLRSAKLDELPQLFNVLRGQMALVGPRPELPEYVECWPAEARSAILSVRPGITDPASIAFRREAEILSRAESPERHYVDVIIPQKVALYVKYVEERSVKGDLKILLQTLLSVVRD